MMRHRAFTLIEAIVVVLIIAILAAIMFPLTTRRGEGVRGTACRSNLEQIGLAFRVYALDSNDHLPPVANARAEDWAGSLQPYLAALGYRGWSLFQCPSDETSAPQTTDYFFNARLNRLEYGTMSEPSLTILAGDGTSDNPTSYNLWQLPDAWRHADRSPATRHLEKGNYLFAAGHVKALKPAEVTLEAPSKRRPTFLVK